MTFNVRSAEVSDAQEIASIHVNSWKSAFKGLMPERYINSYTLDQRNTEWLNVLGSNSEHVIVAEKENSLVGFLSFNNKSIDTLELSKLYLCPSIYSKGVGYLLMKQFENSAKASGINQLSLYVLDNNQAAIKFYSKHGFKLADGYVAEDFEGETIIDILMEKRLSA